MKISITNYNNIKDLTYEIEDNKINYLVGISGSGKSSIANSLIDSNVEEHYPFGNKKLVPTIKVNDENIVYSDYKGFNMDYMNNILITKSEKNDVYNIIVGRFNNLDKIKQNYLELIESLINKKQEIFNLNRMITTLIEALKINYNKDEETYKSTCLIRKLTDNIDNTATKYVKNKKYDSKRIKWFADGKNTEEYKKNKCPFCNRKLTESKMQSIEKIVVIDAKTYEKIDSNTGLFTDLNIQQPNWIKKKEVEKFNKIIKMYYSINKELTDIIQYINCAEKTDIIISDLRKVVPSTNMKELCPEIYEAIKQFNKDYGKIRKELDKVKKQSDKLIRTNVKRINNYIEIIGIPYVFEKTKLEDSTKTGSFVIRYKGDCDNKDRTNNLSFGEKNIIGLILFLIANKEYPCLIIDDPASSYDEFRRKVIFDLLYELKEQNSTMLVLSHDPVFAKFAIHHKDEAVRSKTPNKMMQKYLDYTGKVDYIETYEEPRFKPITKESFGTMSQFVREKLDTLPKEINYQVAINMRVYFEINKAPKYHKEVYGYLSSILHGTSKKKIDEALQNNNRTEQQVIDVISNVFGKEYLPVKDDYDKNIDLTNFTIFEKIIYAREKIGKSISEKMIKNELSNIIHLNMAYTVGLNPYKYNYFSKFVYDYITNDLNINLTELPII